LFVLVQPLLHPLRSQSLQIELVEIPGRNRVAQAAAEVALQDVVVLSK
jgi:hypothetical protein